jgi:hypothetical protein
MRDVHGKPMNPPRKHTVGIYGIKELIFSFETHKQAEKWLKMLQAKPETIAQQYAMKFSIKELQ